MKPLIRTTSHNFCGHPSRAGGYHFTNYDEDDAQEKPTLPPKERGAADHLLRRYCVKDGQTLTDLQRAIRNSLLNAQ